VQEEADTNSSTEAAEKAHKKHERNLGTYWLGGDPGRLDQTNGIGIDELRDIGLLQAGENGLIEFAVRFHVVDKDIVRDGHPVEIR